MPNSGTWSRSARPRDPGAGPRQLRGGMRIKNSRMLAALMLAPLACGGDDMQMATAGVPGGLDSGMDTTGGGDEETEDPGESGKLDVAPVSDLPGQEPE